MGKRLIVIPRWSGDSRSDWYPWLKRELQANETQPFTEIILADMPNTDLPTIPAWVGEVEELLGQDPAAIAETVLVGHSVGSQAVLRSLERLPRGIAVNGVLCVAGWFDVDESWPSIVPWTDTSVDFQRVRAAAGQVEVILSDNDPFTSGYEANRRLWQERLGASVQVVAGAQHFNGPRYPLILQTLLRAFGT